MFVGSAELEAVPQQAQVVSLRDGERGVAEEQLGQGIQCSSW